MIGDGVIELVNNTAHKKSKLLRLTLKREAVFAQLSDRLAKVSETLVKPEDAAQVQNAVVVVKHLQEQLKAMLN